MIKKKINHELMKVLADNYRQLYARCRRQSPAYGREEFEDIFHECLLFAATDVRMLGLRKVSDIEDAFCYRFRMVEFSYSKKKKSRREISYADYQSTQENEEE